VPPDRHSEATFYTWKKKYGELGVSERRKLKHLEDENARLLRIVAAQAAAQTICSALGAVRSSTGTIQQPPSTTSS
jgi:hypothetical protein